MGQINKRLQNKEHKSLDMKDAGLCALLVAVSAVITFLSLGDTHYPASAFYGVQEQTAIIDFGQATAFQGIMYLNGENLNQEFGVFYFSDTV